MSSRTFFLAVAAGLAAAPLAAGDWPQYRGPNRDGVSTETGLLQTWPAGGPPLRWTYTGAGVGYAGPAVVCDRLYLAGGRGDAEYVFALDLTAPPGGPPRELWAAKIGPLFTWEGNTWNAGPNATPTIDGDRVYALGGFGGLVCVDAATGREHWRVNLPKDLGGAVNPIGGGLKDPTPLGWGYAAAPLVDGDKLICCPGSEQGSVAALNKTTGAVLWRSKGLTENASFASAVLATVGGVRQYVVKTDEHTAGVAAADGVLRVSLENGGEADDAIADINRRLVEAGIPVYRLEPAHASLEQRFLQITSRLAEAP